MDHSKFPKFNLNKRPRVFGHLLGYLSDRSTLGLCITGTYVLSICAAEVNAQTCQS